MTPNFELFRKLYVRLLAKPEKLIKLNFYKARPNAYGTPHCVAGELLEMPEAKSFGLAWYAHADMDFYPSLHGAAVLVPGDFSEVPELGVDYSEAKILFSIRLRHDISDKQEALERIEWLFERYNEPLLLTVLEPVHDPRLSVTA